MRMRMRMIRILILSKNLPAILGMDEIGSGLEVDWILEIGDRMDEMRAG